MSADDSLPDDVATLKAMLVAERASRVAAEVKARAASLPPPSAPVVVRYPLGP